jgi:Putative MetA-pathway of phenol degradation
MYPAGPGARRLRATMAGACALVLCAVPALRAQDSTRSPRDAQPERPTVATHAGTVARGFLEIETGVEHDRGPGDARNVIGAFVAKMGLAPNMQLSVFTNASAPGDASFGVGDVALGVKWRLPGDHPWLGEFALLPTVKFATGSVDRGTGTGTTDVSLLLISSRDVGPVHIDLNAGWTHRTGNGEAAPRDASVWTASFGGAVSGPLGWTVEVYGYPGTKGTSGAPPIVAVLAGPTFVVQNTLVLDVGIVVPVQGGQPHALYGGVTYNVGRLWGSGK